MHEWEQLVAMWATVSVVAFSFLCQLLEKYGTFIT
eukprot:SAG31_NODE_13889_length_839_cov_1.320270_1_plen_34_part_10